MRWPVALLSAIAVAASGCQGGAAALADAREDPGDDRPEGSDRGGEPDDAATDAPAPDAPGEAADPSGTDGPARDGLPDGTCECSRNADCDGAFGDTGSCRRAVCDPDSCACILLDSPEEDPCDDDDPCTFDDACRSGACVPGPNRCACAGDDDCLPEEDGNLCNGTLFCNPARVPPVCEVDPSTVVTCVDEASAPCRTFQCNPSSGQCEAVAVNEGDACDDLDPCTTGDACLQGTCTGSGMRACDDREACTTDACEAGKGCVYRPRIGPCDDGNPCTGGEACDTSGRCRGGAELCCDGLVDDDHDGLADCLDPDCVGDWICWP